jgi:hypothetical protein
MGFDEQNERLWLATTVSAGGDPPATEGRSRSSGGTLDKYVLQIVMYCGWIELDAKLFAIQEGCGPIGRIRR